MKIFNNIIYIILLNNISHSIYIRYKGLSSDNEASYTQLVEQIINDPHLDTYRRLRSFLGSRTLSSGPLIAPNWLVRGIHTDLPEAKKNGSFYIIEKDGNQRPQFEKKMSYGVHCDYFVSCNNTDIGLYHCYRLDNQPILDLHILNRATIPDINNTENRFFALTKSLHNKDGGCWKNASSFEDDTYFIPCRSTNMNPSTDSQLTFEIDNTQFPDLYFETYGGDSCSPMLLVTKENEVKVVGPHFPGKTYFNVENIAFPPTKDFIDQFLASTSTQNLPQSFRSGDPSENLWFRYKNTPKTVVNGYEGILIAPQCFLFLSEALIENYIKINNKNFEVLSITNIGSAFKIVFCKEPLTGSIKINNQGDEETDYYMQADKEHNLFQRMRLTNNIEAEYDYFNITGIKPMRLPLIPSPTRLKGISCINSVECPDPTLFGLYYETNNSSKIRWVDNQSQAKIHSEILSFVLDSNTNGLKAYSNGCEGILVAPQCFLFPCESPIRNHITVNNENIDVLGIKNISSVFKLVCCRQAFVNSVKIKDVDPRFQPRIHSEILGFALR